jgi:hypothetical protein
MPTFEVYGKITIDITQEIEAASEEEAVAKAKEELKDYHHLYFDDEVKYDLNAVEYID